MLSFIFHRKKLYSLIVLKGYIRYISFRIIKYGRDTLFPSHSGRLLFPPKYLVFKIQQLHEVHFPSSAGQLMISSHQVYSTEKAVFKKQYAVSY